MPKLCLITDSYPPEIRSASIAMLELANEFAHLGYSVTVATTQPQYNLSLGRPARELPVEESLDSSVNLVRVRSAFLHNVPPAFKGVGQALLTVSVAAALAFRKPRFDAIIVYSPPLPLALAAIFVARAHGSKVIVNVQDIFPQNAIDLGVLKNGVLIKCLRRMEAFIYKNSDRITVHSTGNFEWLASRGLDRVTVIPNWFDFATIPRDINRAILLSLGMPNKFTVFFGGVMGFAQDFDIILDAADHLRANTELQFLILGDGVERARVERLIAGRKLDQIYLRDLVDTPTYRRVLGAVDLGLVTLRKTMTTPAVPSKMLGYFAAALPVVTAVNEESDARRIVEAACAGANVAAGDGCALAKAIEMYSRDATLSTEQGQNGRRYGLEVFGVHQAASKYTEVIENQERS